MRGEAEVDGAGAEDIAIGRLGPSKGAAWMKHDLDRLMAQHEIDAVVVMGSDQDPVVSYFSGGAKLSRALIVKRRGEKGTICVSSIERDNAAASGLAVHLFDTAYYMEARKSSDSVFSASLELYVETLRRLGADKGRVAFQGRTGVGFGYRLLERAAREFPQLEIVTGIEPSVVDQARATKDDVELTHMVDVGKRTSRVMVATRDFVRGHRIVGGRFVKDDESPLTVSDVKRFVRMSLLEHELEDPEGMIFAPGGEGAVPHNPGQPDTPIRPEIPIVFDLFPRAIGGYFHDVTRTWCFGNAPQEVNHLHRDVLGCVEHVLETATTGTTGDEAQHLACDYLRERGHPVNVDDYSATEGFTTGLGHGVGLAVHEPPFMGERQKTPFAPRHVFTVEPGLYYPSREAGVRIEDTVYLDSDGRIHRITDVPYDLVVPLE
jgi:Xaa-Pro aminopeptidase